MRQGPQDGIQHQVQFRTHFLRQESQDEIAVLLQQRVLVPIAPVRVPIREALRRCRYSSRTAYDESILLEWTCPVAIPGRKHGAMILLGHFALYGVARPQDETTARCAVAKQRGRGSVNVVGIARAQQPAVDVAAQAQAIADLRLGGGGSMAVSEAARSAPHWTQRRP